MINLINFMKNNNLTFKTSFTPRKGSTTSGNLTIKVCDNLTGETLKARQPMARGKLASRSVSGKFPIRIDEQYLQSELKNKVIHLLSGIVSNINDFYIRSPELVWECDDIRLGSISSMIDVTHVLEDSVVETIHKAAADSLKDHSVPMNVLDFLTQNKLYLKVNSYAAFHYIHTVTKPTDKLITFTYKAVIIDEEGNIAKLVGDKLDDDILLSSSHLDIEVSVDDFTAQNSVDEIHSSPALTSLFELFRAGKAATEIVVGDRSISLTDVKLNIKAPELYSILTELTTNIK